MRVRKVEKGKKKRQTSGKGEVVGSTVTVYGDLKPE